MGKEHNKQVSDYKKKENAEEAQTKIDILSPCIVVH